MAVQKENVIKDKSFAFAVRIIKATNYIKENKQEYVLTKQLLRSGTAIGALVREAEQAQSRPDFIHKLSIALKETNETLYWIELMTETNYFTAKESSSLMSHATELIKPLISIINSSKASTNNKHQVKKES